ncbi:MAG: hypothetical protein NZ954_01305 [Thermofilaceae archaeon]|nr:hypothetical protein [Thermofilaceae archaeon]MCX8180493.1 hypothetical protein [Thermofilaceae archaeon]MDW8003310.1 hypothetical protein [Thermofilaceae archaeon]
MVVLRVELLLRLNLPDENEASCLEAALTPDNWSDSCSRILTLREGKSIIMNVESWCQSPVSKMRSMADDVFRVLGVLPYLSERFK